MSALFAALVVLLCMASSAIAAGSPTIASESFVNVGQHGVTLNATVDPEGTASSYRFEYGTSLAYGSSTEPAALGAVNENIPVTATLNDTLQAGATYHFRVIVTNASDETTDGADMSFTTYHEGSLVLPDERGYEMVTPLENENVDAYVPTRPGYETIGEVEGYWTHKPFQVAADGNAVVYAAEPSAGDSGMTGYGQGATNMATRSSQGGWTQHPLQPARGGYEGAYQSFSSDLSVAIFGAVPGNELPLAPGAPVSYSALYTRTSSDGVFHPLLTTTPPYRTGKEGPQGFKVANIPDLTGCLCFLSKSVAYAGSTSDFSQSLFEANDALTSSAPGGLEEDPTTHISFAEENNLYDSSEGHLSLVNVLPSGVAEDNATFGAPPIGASSENPPDFNRVISTDGSRIFWTDLNSHDLYVRENAISPTARTVQIDTTQSGSGPSGNGRFWTASSDGSLVFFTDENRLTNDSTAGPGEPDLYEYDFEKPVGSRLIDLTVDTSGSADVQGVLGASEAGDYVYYVAGGVLANGATAQTCVPGGSACNLYVLHRGEPARFIAVLPWGSTDWQPSLAVRTSELTPNGQALTFASTMSPDGTIGSEQVYVYENDTHRLSCASCNPTGEGGSEAYIPVSWSNTEQDRWISDDGDRVFFDGTGPLVAQDRNGKQDVYEWERDGTGSCTESDGCLYLLSGAHPGSASWLIGSSGSGDDLFIVTQAQLGSQDGNEAFDVYDVRVGARPLAQLACTGTGCQGLPGAPPIFATPSSVTFNGVGNFLAPMGSAVKTARKKPTRTQLLAKALRACKKTGKHKRHVCEVNARKRYAVKSKTKSVKGSK
ncbi:MAG: hypothetical protein WB998_00760 [Solirubrobacteraceae bacterium]